MYKFNDRFFECIDTQEKAYILGFMYADGYNSNTQVEFVQLVQDKDILDQINKALESDVPIRVKEDSYHSQPVCYLTFSDRQMCKDLTNQGAMRKKSLIITFPTENIVPKHLIRHFIRGYFDGDGCIWNGKRKRMTVRDPKCKNGYRERIVHNVKFTFTGCKMFINSLQDLLIEEGIVKKKTKLNFSKAKDKETIGWATMEYSGRGQIKKLFDFMYKDATIYGHRKYDKFQEIFCALDEKSSSETGLIAGTPEMEISSQASSSVENEGSSTIPEMEVESSDSKCPALNE